ERARDADQQRQRNSPERLHARLLEPRSTRRSRRIKLKRSSCPSWPSRLMSQSHATDRSRYLLLLRQCVRDVTVQPLLHHRLAVDAHGIRTEPRDGNDDELTAVDLIAR